MIISEPSARRQHYLYFELLADPERAEFVHDVIKGRRPRVPLDDYVRVSYIKSALSVLLAPPEHQDVLRSVVQQARANVFTDSDYAAFNEPIAV